MNGNIFAASGKRMTKTLAAGAVTAVMALGLSMTAFADGGLDIHTEYPGMTAKAGDSLTFTIDMDNSGSACDAVLSVQSLPEG